MKKIICSMLFIMTNIVGFSQVPYSNYWDFTSEWRRYSGGFNGISGFSYYSTIFFDGYEVVNGISYYKEYTNQRYVSSTWTGEPIDETTLYGPVLTREDAAGNFYRIGSDGVEYLTFSNDQIINAQIGNDFPFNYEFNCYVESIETMYLGSQALKRIKGSITADYGGTLEGVGPIGPICSLGIEGNSWLNCYTKQNNTIQFVESISCNSFPSANRVNMGITDQTIKKFSLYPNPNNGNFKISSLSLSSDSKFEIYTINGMNIKSGVLNSSEQSIDISTFSGGIYIVKIYQNNTPEYLKIIKE